MSINTVRNIIAFCAGFICAGFGFLLGIYVAEQPKFPPPPPPGIMLPSHGTFETPGCKWEYEATPDGYHLHRVEVFPEA